MRYKLLIGCAVSGCWSEVLPDLVFNRLTRTKYLLIKGKQKTTVPAMETIVPQHAVEERY